MTTINQTQFNFLSELDDKGAVCFSENKSCRDRSDFRRMTKPLIESGIIVAFARKIAPSIQYKNYFELTLKGRDLIHVLRK